MKKVILLILIGLSWSLFFGDSSSWGVCILFALAFYIGSCLLDVKECNSKIVDQTKTPISKEAKEYMEKQIKQMDKNLDVNSKEYLSKYMPH